MVRRIAAVAFLLVATALTARSFTDASTLLRVLEDGRWPWIAAAIATNVTYFIAYAMLYKLGFAVVGVASRTRSLIPVLFAGLFVNLFVPAGAGSAALLVDDAARRGEHGARAGIGIIVVLLLDLVTLVPFVAWGVGFMAREGLLAPWQLLAAAAFAMYLVLLAALVAVSRLRPRWVHRVLAWSQRVLHRVLRRRSAPSDWPARTAEGFSDAVGAIAANPGRLALAALWATLLHVIDLLGLWLFVRGFGADVPIGALIAVFALGIVLLVIVAIPQLAPVAQAVMTATFIHVGVAAGPAVAATLAFRGLMMVLPLVLGLPFVWWIGRFGTRREDRAQIAPGGVHLGRGDRTTPGDIDEEDRVAVRNDVTRVRRDESLVGTGGDPDGEHDGRAG
jgi:uncharacterized membrane protein YbhN (UPF0104 family)